MKKFILLILLFSFSAFASDDCLFFKYCGNKSSRTSKSLPSSASSANLNPSAISNARGFGVEAVYQHGNPLSYNFVSGNGKIGALISPSLENSFFGNRSIEIDSLQLVRQLNKTQYENKKLNMALGAKLYTNNNVDVDLGLSIKRNPDIKKLNPGIGASVTFPYFHFGAYFYRDDVLVKLGNYSNPYTGILYSSTYGSSSYQEKFAVDTYTFGTSVGNLSLDAGIIKTRYQFYTENTRVNIYSSSYIYNDFILNFAVRKELSPNLLYTDNRMIISRKKSDYYYGLQYLINRNIVVGVQHNNFLLNEWSASLVVYF